MSIFFDVLEENLSINKTRIIENNPPRRPAIIAKGMSCHINVYSNKRPDRSPKYGKFPR